MSELRQTSVGILPDGPGRRILRAAEADAWSDGYRFLAAASAAADRTRQEADAIYQARYAKGYEDGRAEGEREATRLMSDATAKVDRYLAGLDREIAHLAIDIVRRVLGEFDAIDLVLRAASRAITDFRREKSLKVTVHPEALERARTALATDGGGIGPSITVDADPRLEKLACVVASEFAVVDASIDTQLAAIMEGFNITAEPAGERP